MNTGDTIAAISSAVGPAARMILRLSGPRADEIARSLSPDFTRSPASASHSSLAFANVACPAWLCTFRSPHSYTGEDLIEFHTPGNPVLAKMLLDELLHRGARLADAGEFTARAYFAGKLDLAEAEGVAATISASNEQELSAARQLLAGELAVRLRPSIDLIAGTLALIEVGIDFSEEDVTFLPTDEIRRRIDETDGSLSRLLSESVRFERLAHEPRIVLVGRPNAGKSTLINALAGRQRSIVSAVAGTTRDVLSAELDLPHGRVQLLDVAGIDGEPDPTQLEVDENPIERQMREHAMRAVESAEHLVLVRDVTDTRPVISPARQPDLIVVSKSDLAHTPVQGPRDVEDPGLGARDPDIGPALEPGVGSADELPVSAKTGNGIELFRDALDQLAFGGGDSTASSLALNRRHVACIEDARAALSRAINHSSDNTAELIALELREALDALGRVLGSITPDDVLGRIFSSFCIGK